MSDLIGRKLGQYQITGLLGEGGMATVYRAHQTSVRRDVAIKVIESKLARSPEFIRRFEREAMTIAALDHPHILKIHDFGREDDLLYLVMELKSGGSLAQRIRTEQLSAEQVAKYLDQIAAALDHAHAKGFIHRDLKPQNVLLDADENAFLTDFGIAKLLSGESTALTAGGMAMGTPGYMAPEQWYGQQIDARTDLYALAVMTFEMLTGRVPFSGDTPAALMYQHLNEAPPPLRSLRPDLPASLEKVLLKAMAKQPDQRYQSAKSFAAAFQEGLKGKTPTGIDVTAALKPITPLGNLTLSAPYPTNPESPAQRGGRNALVLGGVALLALVGTALILLSGRGGGTVTSTAAPSATAPVVAANPSETTAPSATAAFTSTATETITATFTSTATDTTVPTATLTETSMPSVTPSETALPPTLTETPNLETQIAAVFATDAQATANAIASFTHTPTNTYTPTPDLPQTALALANQTRTAIAIASFTKTPTPTFTPPFTNTPTPTPTPRLLPAGVKPNWTPQTQDFNGVTMVLVPAGCFMMGSNGGNNDEKPVHEVCFNQPFWIDQTEVTNGQFATFQGKAGRESSWTEAERPREQINWYEAALYCGARGARLPTEAEWEYAARGPESLIYPWGDEFVADNVVYGENSNSQTANVGNRPGGVSWVGALDMSGNVWEWTNTIYDQEKFPYPYKANDGRESTSDTNSNRVLRGGSWWVLNNNLRAASRYGNAPDGRDYGGGFRCARSY